MISLKDIEAKAIKTLKSFEPEEGYYLGYSGGKDSDVILALAKLSGVKFHAVHSHTTVDAPETVYYVRKMRDDPENHLHIDYPKTTMWRLIVDHCTLPIRTHRFCCLELKERGGQGELCIMGVRKAESTRRAESSDVVQIIGKPLDTQRQADEFGAEYRTTKQGGAYTQRGRCPNTTACRAMLSDEKVDYKSYRRLVGRGCVGLFAVLWDRGKSALPRGILSSGVCRMPDVEPKEARARTISEIQRKLSPSNRANACAAKRAR